MSRSQQAKYFAAVVSILFSIGLLCFVWVSASDEVTIVREAQDTRQAEAMRKAEEVRKAQDERERLARLEVLNRQIRASVALEEMANRAAVLQADAEIHQQFAGYCGRAEKFSEEITSAKNLFKLTQAKISDQVHGTHGANALVEKVFGETVVSDAKLREGVLAVMGRFQSDREANRNQMLTRVAYDFRVALVPVAPANDLAATTQDAVARQLESRLLSSSSAAQLSNVTAFAGSMAAAQIVGVAAGRAVGVVAGYSAGSAAIGSSVGTFATPLGTVIGAAAGLGIGYAIDKVTDDHTQARIQVEVCGALEQARQGIWSNPVGGMQSELYATVAKTNAAHLSSLLRVARGVPN